MNAKSLQSKPASPAREKWQSYRETVGYAKHVIFRPFDGAEHGVHPARDDPDDHTVRDPVRRTAFHRVEHAETSGCAGTHVDQTSAFRNGFRRRFRRTCDEGKGSRDRIRDGTVSVVDDFYDFRGTVIVNVHRHRIALFGR